MSADWKPGLSNMAIATIIRRKGHCQKPLSDCQQRPDGGQVDPYSGSNEGPLCNDDDGILLQPKAFGVLPACRD